jgi:methionyl aminopeptidase
MSLSQKVLQKYQLAGKIAKEVREKIKRTVREGMLILDLCEKAEALIREKGGKPAFPCNISVNEIAAHYTSPLKDKRRIPENSLVKVDVGVHVDGYIADTATTVCFNPEYEAMVLTAEEALKKATEILRDGLFSSRFGSTIQKTIHKRGFKPISNLTGHNLGRYLVHAGKSLPNVPSFSISRVKAGEVYGVEPFATTRDASGRVENGEDAYIFRFQKHRSLKNFHAKQLLKLIEKEFSTLPFTERWLQSKLTQSKYKDAFRQLLSSKTVMSYPLLIEASRKPVAQAEHTIMILKDGCRVLT